MSKSSVLARKRVSVELGENPFPLVNYEVVSTEEGDRKLVECPVVALSMAADYSIETNSILGRVGGSFYRVSGDVLDLPEKLSQVL